MDPTRTRTRGPTLWLVTRQPADGPDKNKDWGTKPRARELGQGPGTAGTKQNRKGQPRLGYCSEIRILEHGRGCHRSGWEPGNLRMDRIRTITEGQKPRKWEKRSRGMWGGSAHLPLHRRTEQKLGTGS